jgi:beta-N-acetylhexosaminidase
MRQRLCVLLALVTTLAGCGSTAKPEAAATTPAGPAASTAPPASSAAPSVAPSASVAASGDCVTRTLAGMSLEERAGQLLMIGTPVTNPRGLAAEVTRYHLGGIFLSGRSKRPAADLRADIGTLQAAARQDATKLPLLVALDQEGGDVQTLQGPDFPAIPSALRLGAGPASALRTEVSDSTRRLAAIGVTMDLAPVADTVPTSIGEANPPIGAFHRQYGSDPVKVAAAIRTVVATSQAGGVLTTLKHFPGLGRTRFNTDTSTKAVDAVETTHDPYLGPFAAGVKQGTAAVMISSATYPKIDAKNIAAFSTTIVTGLLRKQLGFTGLVISDDLGAADAARAVPTGDRAVRFVQAGGDMVLTIQPGDAGPMTAALLTKARSTPAFAARITDATTHVLRAKAKAGLLKC